MSNPVVIFSNSIPEPSDPSTVRTTYMQKSFDALNFFLYGDGETASSFDPTDMGYEFYYIAQVGDAMNGMGTLPPQFVTTDSWVGLKAAPSAAVTPNYSVMPKRIGPSKLMVDNGIATSAGSNAAQSAYWGPSYDLLFNWSIDKVNGVAPAIPAGWYEAGQVGAFFGSQYVSIKFKDDTQPENTVEMSLASPLTPPTGDWDSAKMVGGGAFMLMLNIIGMTPGQALPSDNEENRWSVVITFGDVTMTIADASTMKVKIAGSENETTVNLAEGASKEGPPQQQHMADKPPLLLGVYPCWNGIVVVNGEQETPQVVKSAGTFCRKLDAASIQSDTYSDWFDTQNPDDVEVGVGSGATNVLVDFGDSLNIVAKNCRFDLAYLPRFFSKALSFDGWLLLADDTDEISYDYDVYTIYTKNGTDYDFTTDPTLIDSGQSGALDDTSYWYVNWKFATESQTYLRWAGEIFSYILRTQETRTYSIKNGNGNFELTWNGGTPGKTGASNWVNYIKGVSVTIEIDGSSGNIEVDKYGVAGQGAVAVQSIGAVVLDATGGSNTVAGNIFKGLGMGISNNESSGDSTWTIPLIGLEKKMDDIALINPPFMDGETLATAVAYLCGYAGLNYDLSKADSSVRLSATEEINSARFDWKSGTSVKTALEDVMSDVNHWYCVMEGKVHVFELDDKGVPIQLGPDRSTGYTNTNIVNIDKSPDFEDLRNYVVGIALQKISDGMGTQTQNIPTFPLIVAMEKDTTPDIPWAKCIVRVFSSELDQGTLSKIVENLNKSLSVYEVTGKLTIPGNASILPYDRWGTQIIMSVTHNIDIESKTWTTDLSFMEKG